MVSSVGQCTEQLQCRTSQTNERTSRKRLCGPFPLPLNGHWRSCECRHYQDKLFPLTPVRICLSEDTTMTSEAPLSLKLHAFLTMYVSASLWLTKTATTRLLTCVNVPCQWTCTVTTSGVIDNEVACCSPYFVLVEHENSG